MKRVAILGASSKETRYSRKAQELLVENGYDVVPISQREDNVLGVKALSTVGEIEGEIDTLTVYVNPKHLAGHVDEIVKADIRRVIFNPGTETESLEKQIKDSGKVVLKACTLVLLRTGQFDKS